MWIRDKLLSLAAIEEEGIPQIRDFEMLELLGGDQEAALYEDEKIAYVLKPKSMKVPDKVKYLDVKGLSNKRPTKDFGMRVDTEFWAFLEGNEKTTKNKSDASNFKARPAPINEAGSLKVNYYSPSRGRNIIMEAIKVNNKGSMEEQLQLALKAGLSSQNCEDSYMQSSLPEIKEIIMKNHGSVGFYEMVGEGANRAGFSESWKGGDSFFINILRTKEGIYLIKK